jgi:hypothetical protein
MRVVIDIVGNKKVVWYENCSSRALQIECCCVVDALIESNLKERDVDNLAYDLVVVDLDENPVSHFDKVSKGEMKPCCHALEILFHAYRHCRTDDTYERCRIDDVADVKDDEHEQDDKEKGNVKHTLHPQEAINIIRLFCNEMF